MPDRRRRRRDRDLIIPRARDLGGFEVRRALPAPKRQMVGPFIFFDQMGPAEFITDGRGSTCARIRISGSATVTYLYRGEFSTATASAPIRWIDPGAVNWMVAGHGVTHSERTERRDARDRHSLFGIQTWIALPEDARGRRRRVPACAEDDLPVMEGEGKEVRLILGSPGANGAGRYRVRDVLCRCRAGAGAAIPLPDDHEDRGVYVVEGAVEVAGEVHRGRPDDGVPPRRPAQLKAGAQGARLMILGGATLEGPRYIWWNFVASSKERIEHAKEAWRRGDWEHGRFRLPPGDDAEFTPLPDRPGP
jgi:redox-sensitive bicupin YhaK (pirin superfamily)